MQNNASWHVCGLMVQAHPEKFASACAGLRAIENCEISVSEAATGKLVVVLEAADAATLLKNIESTRNVEGVLAVSLVYHQQDEQEEQGEETP